MRKVPLCHRSAFDFEFVLVADIIHTMNSTSGLTSLSAVPTAVKEIARFHAALVSGLGLTSRILNGTCGALIFGTLLCILLHKNLRNSKSIIPFNIVLSDFIVIVLRSLLSLVGAEFELFVALLSCDMTSLLSILLAAIHQFITIRVDPFGVRHIITTPRTIAACIITWLLPIPAVIVLSTFYYAAGYTSTCTEMGFLLLTGLFYVFVYKEISKSSGVTISEQRRLENRKVFGTLALVYVTTLVFRTVYKVLTTVAMFKESYMLLLTADIFYYLSAISNSLVYWWRMEEFRSILLKCRRARINVMG